MRISYWSSDVCSSDLPRDRLVPRATDSSHKDEAMPAAPEIAPRIRDSFARQSFMTSIGAEITLIGDGRVVVEAPVGSAFLQQQGFAHGGLLFTLADTAAGYAGHGRAACRERGCQYGEK